ncbi:MAG TPA: thiol reductant ABC exporter subunit CydC [Flexivirga sp.]|uniref:thiol reductant ABC exporter subunit CydC n=1 Tax=Flexivirga sp. TaxID=1962927 RepID=UPI002BCEA9A8|nr:thiol reductant ABC exporter subunit CydC [Flexivirga sp.]HWC24554.1 thiol reductant ABC exporter subunit CydC [Flexivirga sp.]
MRPFDARLLRAEPRVRRPLAALGAIGVVQGALAIAQAVVVAALVVAVVRERSPVVPATLVLTVFGLRAIAGGAAERVAAWAGSYVGNLLRRRAVDGWLGSTIDTRPSETIMLTRATKGAEAIEPYVARYLPALISAAVVPVFALVALACTDWISALIVVLTLPLLPLFAALIGMHTRDETAARWRETDRLTGHFLDVMRGLPTLVNYQRAEHQVGLVRAVGQRWRVATVRTLRTAFLSSAALELLATISVAIVAVAVGLRLVSGGMSLEVGLVAILLAPEAYWPIRRVGQEFHAAADGAQAIDELLAGDAERRTPASGATLRARDLGYRHRGAQQFTVRGLDLDCRPGLTALTGPSGCGKTTVLDLLAGLRTPTVGSVDRPRGVHYVTQRPFLVPGNLAENLAMAGELPPGTDWLPDPLRSLPDGLDTVVGDDGFGLSAGQRALLALTRAKLSGASVVLLDEPTAHLDPAMRRQAEAMIRDLARTRAVVVATHSESLMSLADKVIRLEPTARDGETPAPRSPSTRSATAGTRDLKTPATSAPPLRGDGGSMWRPAPGVLRAAIIGALASTCGVALTATSGWLIVQASTQPPVLTLLVAIVCVRAFGIGRPVLRYVERLRSHDAALGDLVERRASLFSGLIPLTPARLGRRRRADVLTGAVSDLDDEVDVQVRALVPLLGCAVTAVLTLGVVTALHPASGLVLAAVLGAAAAVAWWDYRLESVGQRHTLRARAAVNDAAQLLTTNLPAVQAITAGTPLVEKLDDAAREGTRAAVRQAGGRAAGIAMTTALAGLATVLTAIVAQNGLAAGRLSAPVAALVVLGPLALTDVLATLPDAVGAAARGRRAHDRLGRLTGQPPAVRDPEHAADIPTGPPELCLRDVRASWTGDTTDLAVDDFRVGAGERINITGPNGAGKSTLLAVLARHLEIASGDYTFAGTDTRDNRIADVRERLAIVDDEPHVFAGTVRANLLLARPDAGDTAIARALVDAGLGRWLAALPQGLDTELGDGRDLSGGERTRLAIARALLSARPVLLLDEPVAHLDSPTARVVMHDLRTATAGASVVAVSHQGIEDLAPDREFAIRVPRAQQPRVTVSSW